MVPPPLLWSRGRGRHKKGTYLVQRIHFLEYTPTKEISMEKCRYQVFGRYMQGRGRQTYVSLRNQCQVWTTIILFRHAGTALGHPAPLEGRIHGWLARFKTPIARDSHRAGERGPTLDRQSTNLGLYHQISLFEVVGRGTSSADLGPGRMGSNLHAASSTRDTSILSVQIDE